MIIRDCHTDIWLSPEVSTKDPFEKTRVLARELIPRAIHIPIHCFKTWHYKGTKLYNAIYDLNFDTLISTVLI